MHNQGAKARGRFNLFSSPFRTPFSELRQRAPRNDAEFTPGDVLALSCCDQPLGNKLSNGVVATMRQSTARLLQDSIHFDPGTLAQLAHFKLLALKKACRNKNEAR
jgi:hypothetical protein